MCCICDFCGTCWQITNQSLLHCWIPLNFHLNNLGCSRRLWWWFLVYFSCFTDAGARSLILILIVTLSVLRGYSDLSWVGFHIHQLLLYFIWVFIPVFWRAILRWWRINCWHDIPDSSTVSSNVDGLNRLFIWGFSIGANSNAVTFISRWAQPWVEYFQI